MIIRQYFFINKRQSVANWQFLCNKKKTLIKEKKFNHCELF